MPLEHQGKDGKTDCRTGSQGDRPDDIVVNDTTPASGDSTGIIPLALILILALPCICLREVLRAYSVDLRMANHQGLAEYSI